MLHNLRISIHYPIAISLLAALYLFLFNEPVMHPPVYYMGDGLVVLSETPEIEAGTRLVSPYCRAFEAGKFLCSIRSNSVVLDIVLPGKTINAAEFLRLFHIPVLLSFLLLFFAAWFLDNSRDFLISSFFFWLTIFVVLTLYTIVYDRAVVVWTMLGYFVPITLLNLNLRISGRIINARLLITESVLLLFLGLLVLAAEGSTGFRSGTIQIIALLFWSVTALSVMIQVMAAFDKSNDRIDRVKKIVASAGTLLGVALPVALLLYLPNFLPGFFYLLLLIFFPLSLIYGTYRMHLVPFQFFVTRSIAAALLTFLFLAIYSVVLYVYSMALPETGNRWIVNTVFLLLLVFFLDPLRTRISSFIEQRFLLPRGEHSESLKRLAEIISRSSRPRVAVQAILDEINQTLGLQRSYFLTVPDFFFYLDLREQHVLRLSAGSPIWSLLKPEKMHFAAYLTYGTGARKELFEFLYHKRIVLAIGLGERRNLIQRIHAVIDGRLRSPKKAATSENLACAFLVGYPHGRDRLYLHEIRYLQEAARLAGMMLFNMHALIREVDKRKKVRDLQQSGQYQKLYTLNPDPAPETLDYRFFNRPVLSVTGDYIDIVRLDFQRTAVFLGDVSGHGLGTGFLVSALRAIVRTSIGSGKSLPEVLEILNEFLTDRYSGYEFLTLFAMILNLQDGRIEYINAAHPGAYLKLPGGPLEKLENTQRLLGILPGPYKSFTYQIKPGQRVFLFSDGVLETANSRDEFFGESRLAAFLTEKGDDPLDDIVAGLQTSLISFRGSAPPGDDTSFLVLEYLPARSLLDFVLRGLGIRR
jgi:protein phosphatase